MLEIQLIMKILKKKPKVKTKEKLSKRSGICRTYADKIFSTSPTLMQIEKVCLHIWDMAYGEGYRDKTLDSNRLRDCKEKQFLRLWNELQTVIEDKIHKEKS